MSESVIERYPFQAKWYLNGFPKSGLHLVAQMLHPVAQPQPAEDIDLWKKPWAGTFKRNSWSEEWTAPEQALYRIGRLQDGHFLKSHTGYTDEVERFLYFLGVAHVFIYRDPRDVAVSQAYHILNENDERFCHPGKELYRAMDGFSDVLMAVIRGVDRYPGVMQRWRHYAPWLDVDWVHRVRFEDLRADPHGCAEAILRYGFDRVAPLYGQKLIVDEDAVSIVVQMMVANSERTGRSPTFRKGTVGQWREEFTEAHRAAFKETDAEGWVVKLGYEEKEDW